MGASLLALEGVDLGHGDRVVLPGLRLGLCHGELVALLGQSGDGKSSLLHELRHRLGESAAWCPQQHGLVPGLAVYHNVYMGRLAEHSALANLWNLVRPLAEPWRQVAELCE
ncbi:MAG: phosphonate ABC transporter ATP-binding protein, partial [Halomonas sp.]|nr:phosphonate ABC transporter ATP-binding protein [Halomonas sp.]